MAIRIIDGKIGSGKTYYAVKHLVDNYFVYQDGEYLLNKECQIITNIDSFHLESLDLIEEIKKAGSVHEFFSIEYQEKCNIGVTH